MTSWRDHDKKRCSLSITMGRVSQYFQWVTIILCLSVILVAGTGCSSPATPPKLARIAPQQAAARQVCSNLKLVGPLSSTQFKNLFQCLNRDDALGGLKPLVFDDLQNKNFLLTTHNNFLNTSGRQRAQILKFLKALHQNGGLDKLFSLISETLNAFIVTDDFETHIKPLLSEIYNDDHDLLQLLRAVVSYPRFFELVRVLNDAFENSSSRHYLVSLGNFLRHEDASGRKGYQHLIAALSALFERAQREDAPSFGLEDIYQMSLHRVPQNLLHAFEALKREQKITPLNELLSDLTHHQTAAFLTDQRRELLRKAPHQLTVSQRNASFRILKKHPVNDLASFIKLHGSLHRPLVANTLQDSNLLASLDIFLKGIKDAFDVEPVLGPDAEASRVMTVYTLYTNIAYLELLSDEFHQKPIAEKIDLYKSGDHPYFQNYTAGKRYATYPGRYKDRKAQLFAQSMDELQEKLSDEKDEQGQPKWTPLEIGRMIRDKKKTFIKETLPELVLTYQSFLDTHVRQAFEAINTKTIFKHHTIYDFLKTLKGVPSIALYLEQALIRMDEADMDLLMRQVIHGLLRDIFEFHAPVDAFLRSREDRASGATWLAHTIDPLIHGLSGSMPLEDLMTFIGLIEFSQVMERLLLTQHKISDIRNTVFPLMRAVHQNGRQNGGQNGRDNDRLLRLFQFLHSGRFLSVAEADELINQIMPAVVTAVDSGLLEETLHLLAALGPHGDLINDFLIYLTRRITPAVEILQNITARQSEGLSNALQHLSGLLKPAPVDQLRYFLNRYDEARRHLNRPSENFLTAWIKKDEMRDLLNMMKHLLLKNQLQPIGRTIQKLLDSGELKKTLLLWVSLLEEAR